jgi:hypothetical protein
MGVLPRLGFLGGLPTCCCRRMKPPQSPAMNALKEWSKPSHDAIEHELAYGLHRVLQTNAHLADVDLAIIQSGEDHSGPEWQREIMPGFDWLVGEERQHARVRLSGRTAGRASLRRRHARRVARLGRSFRTLCNRCDQHHDYELYADLMLLSAGAQAIL